MKIAAYLISSILPYTASAGDEDESSDVSVSFSLLERRSQGVWVPALGKRGD